jgi:transposase-like protein
LESALEAEMDERLGYASGARESKATLSERNGVRSKTVATQIGPVRFDVSRDRDASFEPVIAVRRQRRLNGVDEIVLSLTARGLTSGEVCAHLQEVYGTSVSKQTVSRITDKVIEEMTQWQNRPLDRGCPVVFIDAIGVKALDGRVADKPSRCRRGRDRER